MEEHKQAVQIVETLRAASYVAYFAGGWVRDYLMGNDSNDIDIATDAQPEEITQLFPNTVLVGAAFGVVVVIAGGQQYEVATFRRDFDYIDGRKPQRVEYCSAEEDAKRRDFTINGLFYDPLDGKVYDYVGGIDDIKRGTVKAIGDPHSRFFEDKLRMVRAFRFAARFRFAIDPPTYEAIVAHAAALFPAVAMERVWHEFSKMAEAPGFSEALAEMQRAGLLQVIFPALEGTASDLIRERTAYPAGTPAILYLAALFPNGRKEELEELCRYLKCSRRDLCWVENYLKAKEIARLGKGAPDPLWVEFLSSSDSSLCLEAAASIMKEGEQLLLLAGEKRHQLARAIERRQERRPLVGSALLKEEGIAPGVKMGRLIAEGEKLSIERKIENPAELLALLKSLPLWEEP